MNPLRIRAANYRTLRELDLDLPAGTVGIVGTNGAGKSSIVNAIDLALFGPEGRSWAPYLTVGASSTELMVELTFEHAGELYRVRRGYSGRGAGKSTLDLERWQETDDVVEAELHPFAPTWHALTLGSAKETQARLEQLLGFSRRTFGASSFLRQSDGGAFCEADPRDRKRILADTLGLDRFETLLAAVRRDRRHADQQVQQIDGRLQGVTREALDEQRAQLAAAIDAAGENERVAAAALAAAEQELEQAATQVQAATSAAAERASAVARRDAAAAELAAKVRLREDAVEAEKRAGIVLDEIASLTTPEQLAELERKEEELGDRIDGYARLTRERNEIVVLHEQRVLHRNGLLGQASELNEKAHAKRLEATGLEQRGPGDAHCDRCGQTLGAEALASALASLRVEADNLDAGAKDLDAQAAAIEIPAVPPAPEPPRSPDGTPLDTELAATKQQLRFARDAALQRTRLEERLAGYQRTIAAAASPEYAAELAACEQAVLEASNAITLLPAPVDINALEAAAVKTRGKVELERQRQQAAAQEKAVGEERLAQLTDTIARHERDLQARVGYQAEIDLLAILERAYGPDGIPALIVENAAIPAIEVEANRILVALAGTTAGCRVELRTDRAKADGGVRDDVLDVLVVTEAGERSYETFSGGERTRLNLALRIALARLLATRRGAESRVLAIDEPEFLDEDGTAALVDVLRELEQNGVFDRVYLVSHVPALRDSFDTVLQVVKGEDGRSFVE